MSFNSVEFLEKKILFYVILVSEVIQEKKKGKNRKQLYLKKQFALRQHFIKFVNFVSPEQRNVAEEELCLDCSVF